MEDTRRKTGDLAAEAGIRRVHVLAWRDLDDVEAGGSEVHAASVASAWAAAGLEVTCRTSFAQGQPPERMRDGYRVIRRAGRYLVFPRAVAAELAGLHGRRDALVEIWNGVPFLTPLWARGPCVTWLHHIHGQMWDMVLPPALAAVGRTLELRVAPPLYRRASVVTLSHSSREEIVAGFRFDPSRVHVVPPGVDDRFTPGTWPRPPLVLAVGRLVPSKHVDLLVRAVARARLRVPDLRLVVAGEGYERLRIEAVVRELGAESWVELRGRVDDEELLRLYRSARVLASASSHEGWGMTVTEAAACGTPAVVTDIPGHRDAVDADRTGILAPVEDLGRRLGDLAADPGRCARMGEAAVASAEGHRWDETARALMAVLAGQADARRRRRGGSGPAR